MSAREGNDLPTYAVFDDHRYSQRVAVMVRWFLLIGWLFLVNYQPDTSGATLLLLNVMGVSLAILNAYVHWRIWVGRPITRRYVLALSIMDLTIITIGIGATTRFGNTFFVFYYPALLGVALVFPSRRLSFTVVGVVAGVYAILSFVMSPGVDFALHEERILLVRVLTMFAVVAAANLMTRIEVLRRREAVRAEKEQLQRNMELQRKAQEAELAAQQERNRIAREIHDGIAQSIYALSLNLETAAHIAEGENGALKDQLGKLVPLAKKTLLETRHYMYDLKPLLSSEDDFVAMAEHQVQEFRTITGIRATLLRQGEPRQLPVSAAMGMYRILQESLANVLKHANASRVTVTLAFEPKSVCLSVKDDGVGFDTLSHGAGYGLDNMRQRAEELGGTFEMTSAPGEGTFLTVTLPTREVENAKNQAADS
ncbi:MAG: sensor histidine kinase [Chloroflexi bacterium]|nr:sensor histidine kinase [Chloroflexota bacterium]